ncbi:sigma-70 family RNA polymerase sigma factor [Nocardioides islandensis]|jgi:RNA polymerase sigma-70 factor (ECF subfamily)|uniref:Sigma-70 family RNA polymerase sigma factor n=1 Tax=Nocardioides islandensis TaxID=433663 RepID=A0A930YES4_9ACTN|nr:sigma-70 family RNA polymerase sigma factor [Nocardioides islandensis]MBF4764053.1 sigma-70 family RNA polymerase sigma factor [Nocardioides islandensis]
MTDEILLAEQFEAERPRVRGLAARMLGNDAAADDAVQEAWIRLVRTDQRGDEIDNLPGWLTTVVSRICLDVLRSRTAHREDAFADDADVVDTAPTPEEQVELVDAVGQAMTVVLDTLAPAERLAYVLKDVFAVPFDQIAPIIGRSEVATRQLASRARRRLQEPEPREDLAAADAAVVDAFMAASRDNEFAALLELLDPDAEVLTDQAAAAMGSQATYLTGSRNIAEFFAGRAKAALPATLDGGAASCWQHLGEVKVVFAFTVVDGKVRQIELLADPSVLTRVGRRSPRRS